VVAAAAFFDVDNTLMRGASIYYFAKGLATRRYFRTRDLVGFAWHQAKFRARGESHDTLALAKESALAFVAGREVAEIERLGEEIYDEEMADRIWSGTRALAEQHLRDGMQVWLVTATPVELASVIADRLGLTGALGTVAQVEDGRYTGHLDGDPLHGPAKADAVIALAAKEGLELAECYAYSDSVNDLPMLRAVGHPAVVNPDGDLRDTARAEGWPVHDFRTGRRAVKVGVPAALAAGAVVGGTAAGFAVRRRRA
jgi:HAD superfamily hydrolase (TIGR01490 family)